MLSSSIDERNGSTRSRDDVVIPEVTLAKQHHALVANIGGNEVGKEFCNDCEIEHTTAVVDHSEIDVTTALVNRSDRHAHSVR